MTEEKLQERNRGKLAELHPGVRGRVGRVLAEMRRRGWRPRLQQAWRSPEEQLKAFEEHRSKLKWGFHNACSAAGKPEALAADILDDTKLYAAPPRYYLELAACAAAAGLDTGVDWGLPPALRDGLWAAIRAEQWDAKVKLGWDPSHVQVRGLSVAAARAGQRPRA